MLKDYIHREKSEFGKVYFFFQQFYGKFDLPYNYSK